MALHNPIGIGERICNFGVAGVGKSYDFYTIPRLAAKTRSSARFFIVDTDASAKMMLSDPAFAAIDMTNIVIESAYNWEAVMNAMTLFQGELAGPGFVDGQMGDDDWLLIDMLTPVWQWVQDWYTRKTFGATLDAHFAAMKKANKKTMFETEDWQAMNFEYGKLANRILRCAGNVFVTAQQKGVPQTADTAQRLDFGPIGFVPAGQKNTPHLFHSCFHKRVSLQGEYLVTSAKNRSRPKLESEPIEDFAIEVLVRNRGWKLA